MAHQGHVGYTVTVVETDIGLEVFAWSPYPGVVRPSDVELMFDGMMSSMTENKEDWRMWYEGTLQGSSKGTDV